MDLNPVVQTSMTNFCAIHRDEMIFENKYKKQYREIAENEKKYKTQLEQYLAHEKQSCIGVTIPVDEHNQQTMYLRFKPKTSQKMVNEDSFHAVIDHFPAPDDLYQTFKKLKNSQATLTEVYGQWLIDTLYSQNTTKKMVFEFTTTKEKKKSGGKSDNKNRNSESLDDSPVKIPREIMEMASQLYKIQYNKKELNQYKKQKCQEFTAEKKQYVPVLEKFLSSKPESKQEQKISMNIQGETKPFCLKKIVKTPTPSLTLSKSRPVVLQSVHTTIKTAFPQWVDRPFQTQMVHDLENHPDFLHVLMAEFKNQLQYYKKTSAKTSTSIVLEEHKNRRKRTSREEPPLDEDADEGTEGTEGTEDDMERP